MSTTSFDSDYPSSPFFQNQSSSRACSDAPKFDPECPANKRLIRWNVELLSQLLRQVMARAASTQSNSNRRLRGSPRKRLATQGTMLDEVKDVLALPKFDPKNNSVDPDSIKLPQQVTSQLTSFVTEVACMYKQNPFHNFGKQGCVFELCDSHAITHRVSYPLFSRTRFARNTKCYQAA